jgi:4,5-DOPA dioxygenase extradiol
MELLPAIFFGHGNPMNALEDNEWTAAWTAIGAAIQRPRAVLSISAHWYVPEKLVTAMPRPRTIHDFGGFPEELYEVSYPAPGDPDLANRIRSLLEPLPIEGDVEWGLDHGTWTVLRHVFPNADIPVEQLSIDERQPAPYHYEVGRRLAPLRDERVLVVGSGNIVHNLHAYSWGREPIEAFDWGRRFEEKARELIVSGNHEPLVNYESLGRDALLSAPTPDHYLPLLYVLGAQREGEPVSFPVEGFDGGSVSMLAVQIG